MPLQQDSLFANIGDACGMTHGIQMVHCWTFIITESYMI